MISIENKLQELGFIVKSIKEGRVNRCGTIDKPNKKNGWFRVYDESVIYGSWDDAIPNGYFWTKEITPLTPEEKQAYAKKRAEQEIKQRELEEIERLERLNSVNKYTENVLPMITTNNKNHPYLTKKQVDWREDFKVDKQGNLIIPVYHL